MHENTGPFLSAAALRRILQLHPFSEANHAYLLQEAERRAEWEQEIEALVCETLPSIDAPCAGPVARREVAGMDATHLHS